MSIHLSGDHQLWGLVEKNSFVYKRLDWLTKFKLTQTLSRKTAELSPRIQEIVRGCEWPELLHVKPAKSVTLIETSLMLPTNGILFYEMQPKASAESWSELLKVLQNLKLTSGRFFIPQNFEVPKKVTEAFAAENINFDLFDDKILTNPWNWS